MSQRALFINRCVCLLALVLANDVSLFAVQQRTVQSTSAAKASNAEIVEKLKLATQDLFDASAPGDKAVWSVTWLKAVSTRMRKAEC
jgi:hypothetical protein